MKSLNFPVGYQKFHKDTHINFQINRWYSMGYWTLDEAQQIGKRVKKLEDWIPQMTKFAAQLEQNGRDLAAAIAIRAAEFFTEPDDPQKLKFYEQFMGKFYSVIDDDSMLPVQVPYQNSFLPALHFPVENPKNKIVLHGGLDSFQEELYTSAKYLQDQGFEVILFDGPGQGSAIRKYNLYMTHEWEKPTSAVLDHFKLEDVTLIGLSLGGYLAPRAAAFDKRISRLVCFDVFLYDQHGKGLQRSIYEWFLKNPGFYNWVANASMRMNVNARHVINQWMYLTNTRTPFDWMILLEDYSVSDIAHLIDQDVLLLAGENDHMIPLKEYENNMQGMINAKSMTGRIFTVEEHAHNHCQVGNLKLALHVIMEWIESF